MKINNHKINFKNKNAPLIILAVLVLTVVCVLVIFIYINRGARPDTTNTVNYDKPTDSQVDAGNNIKQYSVDSSTVTDDTTPADKKTVSVFITDANQYGNIVEVRAYVNEVGSNGGCSITMSKNGTIVTKEATVLAGASTSSCKTTDIPVSEFSSDGTWSTKVSYSSDSAIGESASIDVTVTR